jgi:hypothetical protein
VLHAKRVTVMPKDIRLVRDLWKCIKPDDPIAQMSDETMDGIVRANRLDEALKMKQRQAAYEKKVGLERIGARVPRWLSHYLAGVTTDTAGNFVRPGKVYRNLTMPSVL